MELWRLALRNVLRNRGRTLLTIGAIALGVGGLVLTGGFVEDLSAQLAEATVHSHLGHLQIYRRGYYEFGAQQPARYLIDSPAEVDAAVRSIPRVEDSLHRLEFQGVLNNGRADWAVLGEGGEPDKEARLGTFVTYMEGRGLNERDRFGMVVGQGVAKALRLHAGNRVTLMANAEGGVLNSLEFNVVGIFRTFSKDYDDRAVRTSLSAAQQLMDTRAVNAVVVTLAETDATAAAADRIAAALPAERYEIKRWNELSDFYEKAVGLFAREFRVMNAIILVMILLSALNAINLTTFERTGEFGTMRALGGTGRLVFRLLMRETVLLAFVGAAVGVLFGISTALVISAIGIPMPPPPNADVGYTATIRVVPVIVGGAFILGAIAVSLAGITPALRASRLGIAEALRQHI
jgi:putative ABC transport system permease protein